MQLLIVIYVTFHLPHSDICISRCNNLCPMNLLPATPMLLLDFDRTFKYSVDALPKSRRLQTFCYTLAIWRHFRQAAPKHLNVSIMMFWTSKGCKFIFTLCLSKWPNGRQAQTKVAPNTFLEAFWNKGAALKVKSQNLTKPANFEPQSQSLSLSKSRHLKWHGTLM